MLRWENYNPDWLVEAAQEQIPEEKVIIHNLKKCIMCFKESKAYHYFILPKNPNEPNSDWQFDENILLRDTKHGDIVLDILKGKVIGGIEFLKYL